MNHHGRHNPLHIVALLVGLCLLLAAVIRPGLFRLDAPDTGAVGGYDAVDLLGQLDGGGDPVYTTSATNNGEGSPNERGFNYPSDVVVDTTNHRLFVTEESNTRVLVFNLDANDELLDHTADFVLGQPNFTTNADGTTANTLSFVGGMAYDALGDRLFVADGLNDRVMVWELSGGITNGMAAAHVLGQTNFTTGTNGTNQSKLFVPTGVAYDGTSRLFVVDAANNRVMVFDVAVIIDGEPAINVLGQPDFTTGSSGLTQSKLNDPRRSVYDAGANRLFVSDDFNNRVMVFDVDSTVLVPLAPLDPCVVPTSCGPDAINVLGQPNFVTSAAATNQSTLNHPEGIAHDASGDRLFVADGLNRRVMVFDLSDGIDDGEDATDVYGQTDFTSATIGTTQSTFALPRGLAWAGARLHVADGGNHRVMIFEEIPVSVTPHEAIDVFGQTDDSDDITFTEGDPHNSIEPSEFGFDRPKGVSIDTVGHRMFVADTRNSRVLVFNLTVGNELTEFAADAVLGQADFSSNTAVTTQEGMNNPMNVLYDEGDERLFVADTFNNRILVYDASDGIATGESAAFVLGQLDFTSNAAATTQDGMNLPEGMAYDAVGKRLFTSEDLNDRVLVFDVSTISDGQLAVNVLGQANFTSSGGGPAQNGFGARVRGLAYAPGILGGNDALFVADHDVSRVMVFDVTAITDDEPAVHVLGQPGWVTSACNITQDGMCGPNGVAYDADTGRVFTMEMENHRVLVFDVSGGITDGMPADSVLGQQDFTSNMQGTSRSQLDLGDDDFGLEDFHGGITYEAGTAMLYVTDTENHRVEGFDTAAIGDGEVAVVTLGHTSDGSDFTFNSVSSNNAPVRDGFADPSNVIIDSVHHRLFVGDYSNRRILIYDLDNDDWRLDHTPDAVLGQSDFISTVASTSAVGFGSAPEQMAYDATNDRLFVVDDLGRVLVYDTTTIASGEAAVNVLGKPDFTSPYDTTPTATNIGYASGLAYDEANQRLFVAEWDTASRVVVWDLSGGIFDGMAASKSLGQPDLTSGGSGTSATEMDGPVKLAFDADGQRLFVEDFENDRILVFDVLTVDNGEAAINVLGQSDFSGNSGGTSASEMGGGWGLAYDATNSHLYLGDYSNNRVLVWDVDSITDGEDAIDVYGQASFTSSTAGTSDTELNGPNGVFVDEGNERLYVADTANHRVLVFGPAPTPTPGGGSNNPPTPVGFTPGHIVINDDDSTTDSRNVLVDVYAQTTGNFTGTVDVLLSNTTSFTTFVPFRYAIPEIRPNGNATRDIWPKTIAWDLCFGLTDTTTCKLGIHTVYGRFYVNVPAPTPALVRPNEGSMLLSR